MDQVHGVDMLMRYQNCVWKPFTGRWAFFVSAVDIFLCNALTAYLFFFSLSLLFFDYSLIIQYEATEQFKHTHTLCKNFAVWNLFLKRMDSLNIQWNSTQATLGVGKWTYYEWYQWTHTLTAYFLD